MATERPAGNGFRNPSDVEHEQRVESYWRAGAEGREPLWLDGWGDRPAAARLKPETVDMVFGALRQYEAYLAPADRAQTSVRIAALMAHYFVPDMPAGLQAVLMNDWLAALAEYPAWAIQQACRTWLRGEKRKPTIAEFIAICGDATNDARTEVRVLERAIEHQGPTPELADADYGETTILGAG